MHSLLGIWLFGALLRRELLSVAFHIFHFVDTDLLFRRWWKTARFKFLVMANLVPFIYSDVGAPASPIVFASDAQGSGELEGADCGGFGIVAAELPLPAVPSAWRAGFAPGKSITRLDGTMGTRWKAHKTAAPATPFSRLPREFWEADWKVLAQGRWKWHDHITLGESRAHFRIAQALAACDDAHGLRFLGLQDNSPTSASMMKGRSPSPALNYYCRRRGASLLASQIMLLAPWIETTKQPADAASRQRAALPGSAPGGPDQRRYYATVPKSTRAVSGISC